MKKPKTKLNKCGECTLCCTLFELPELGKKANEDCVNCIVGKGCKIWEKRPKICRTFDCAWLQMKNVSEKLRPDKCGVVFEKIGNKLFFGTLAPDKKLPDIVRGQINSFIREGFSVVIRSAKDGSFQYSLANGHNKDMIKAIMDDFRRENTWQRMATI